MQIFGNEISKKDYKKACKGQKKFIKKFGDDRNVDYKLNLKEGKSINDIDKDLILWDSNNGKNK